MSMPDGQEIYEQAQRVKNELWSLDLEQLLGDAPQNLRIVAEGDSWFDYPIGVDILDHLRMVHGYAVYKVAKAGDTIDNMVYGGQIAHTLAAVARHRPKVVLFSAGGNDIAGYEFESLLNHRKSGLPILREAYIDYLFRTAFKTAYETFMIRVWEIDPAIKIVTHGYANAIPDGRGLFGRSREVDLFPPIEFLGPWLRPALLKKGVTDPVESEGTVRNVINRFNAMLKQLSNEHERCIYLDLRPIIGRSDWVNELHLTNDGFRRVANVFRDAIRAAIGK